MQELNDNISIQMLEWVQALEDVVESDGKEAAILILNKLQQKAKNLHLPTISSVNSDYINSLKEIKYPGNIEIEKKIESIIRWNAIMMVVKANKIDDSLGGHIGTFASSCTLYEVAQNHFFHAQNNDTLGDLVFFQGHASPGMYSRSYLEGRLTTEHLNSFRRDTKEYGLSSYPHPWLMPDYWQFPTVSMGLGPLASIYQAKFIKYLESRSLIKNQKHRKVWTFCGDGEMDEPESLGAIVRAGREKLDNLIFIINCNLQRLDGLVNGNGKIIQEFESVFIGAGWNVIKVIWGSDWNNLFEKDTSGTLIKYLNKTCDGDFQTYKARGGSYMREKFFGQDPELKKLVSHMTDEEIHLLSRGGHDRVQIHTAYHSAINHIGSPTVILVKTIKAYGIGPGKESCNIAHNVKKLSLPELKLLRDNFNLPINDKDIEEMNFYLPNKDSDEIKYLHEQRRKLGGYLPKRIINNNNFIIPSYKEFASRLLGGIDRSISTTAAYVQILIALCKNKSFGKNIVPITPDESRTFGMEGLFRSLGIYNQFGQLYEPEDKTQIMYYKESKTGQILQEGINEAGAFASWLAAATSYCTHNITMIPFYIYYSMFGFQRIGDMAWLAGDMRAKGFLLGATAGRTTLNGEGLQHEDGHSHIMANLVPNCISYDPTYAHELAVIIWHGLNEMYIKNKDIYFYITLMNEAYTHPKMPPSSEAGIIKGMYLLNTFGNNNIEKCVQLMGSGSILREIEYAAEILLNDFDISSNVWSVTSANALYRDGHDQIRNNTKPYITQLLDNTKGPIIAATDYVKLYTEQLRCFIPNNRNYSCLGTDGFGRSDTRANLRSHFEVDRYYIVYTAIKDLVKNNILSDEILKKAITKYNINLDKQNPLYR
jgi:pyruvate dehydrogenase E1 component